MCKAIDVASYILQETSAPRPFAAATMPTPRHGMVPMLQYVGIVRNCAFPHGRTGTAWAYAGQRAKTPDLPPCQLIHLFDYKQIRSQR